MLWHQFLYFFSNTLKSGNNSLKITITSGATRYIVVRIILLTISNVPSGVLESSSCFCENSKGKYETSPAKLQKPSINLPLTISPAPAFKEIA